MTTVGAAVLPGTGVGVIGVAVGLVANEAAGTTVGEVLVSINNATPPTISSTRIKLGSRPEMIPNAKLDIVRAGLLINGKCRRLLARKRTGTGH